MRIAYWFLSIFKQKGVEMKIRLTTVLMAGALCLGAIHPAQALIIFQTGFEAPGYAVGNLDGQDGWSTDIGALNDIQVRDDGPLVGAQAIRIFTGGAVLNTRAIRSIPLDATNRLLSLSSRIVSTTGTRSGLEFSSVFGSTGFLGGLQRASNDELVLRTALSTFSTGFFVGFAFQEIGLEFDFSTGLASASLNGTQIASGVSFDSSNSALTQVAAVSLVTAGADAVQIDEFSVSVSAVPVPVPVPATLALFGLGLAGLGWSRRKKA
jgi:hypothetical protein